MYTKTQHFKTHVKNKQHSKETVDKQKKQFKQQLTPQQIKRTKKHKKGQARKHTAN